MGNESEEKILFEKEFEVRINKTCFNSNVYTLPQDDYFKKWELNENKINTRNKDYKKGIRTKIVVFDKVFDATTDTNSKKIIEIERPISERSPKTEKIIMCTNGSGFRFSTGGDFTAIIGDTFWATRLCSRMSEKGKSCDIGEKMKVKISYGVILKSQEQFVIIRVLELCSLDKLASPPESLTLAGYSIQYGFAKQLETIFKQEHICIQPDSPTGKIRWKPPTDWIVPPLKGTHKHSQAYKSAFEVKYAVYMWIGINSKKPEQKYLYIGIVGQERNKNNSVGNRIFNQEIKNGIAAENGINVIERFRYAELIESGKCSAAEVLQTVEMQCLNNLSALFPYQSYSNAQPETIINSLFTGVIEPNSNYSLILLNKKKRYHNS